MVKLLFNVNSDPGVEPLLAEVHDDWVVGCPGDFEEVGEGTYVIVEDEDYWAFRYTRNILEGPWPEIEEVIKKGDHWAYAYAYEVLGLRHDEAKRWAGD